MRYARFPVFLLVITTACSTSMDESISMGGASSQRAERAISGATGQALQGHMKQALAELQSAPSAEFGRRDSAIRSCMIQRFHSAAGDGVPTEFGPFANGAIGAYRAYWHRALLNPESKAVGEKQLYEELARLVGLPAGSEPSLVEKEVKKRFEREGLHALTGRTPPLLELILWEKETRQSRKVLLPDGEYDVLVKILDDFASLGWSAYATCDRSFTGGWVTPDAIYAVRPGWKSFQEENFRISFLAHETQHFADNERFGSLDSWVLEYRGKLAELALAKTTIPRLLAVFASNQGDDPSVPHSYANKRVLIDLRRELDISPESGFGDVTSDILNEAARALLLRDSQKRSGRLRPPATGLRPV